MSDTKSGHSQRADQLKRWTDRLRLAVGAALFDDLIRLIGEYCLSRLLWSPELHSNRIAITDADAEGFGRSLHVTGVLPAGIREEDPLFGWCAALSAAPLSELAGGSTEFSWAVRVDDWASISLTVGVTYPDAKCLPPAFGVCRRHAAP